MLNAWCRAMALCLEKSDWIWKLWEKNKKDIIEQIHVQRLEKLNVECG